MVSRGICDRVEDERAESIRRMAESLGSAERSSFYGTFLMIEIEAQDRWVRENFPSWIQAGYYRV